MYFTRARRAYIPRIKILVCLKNLKNKNLKPYYRIVLNETLETLNLKEEKIKL